MGTSKTFRSLARVCGAAPSGEGMLVRRVLPADVLSAKLPELVAMTNAEKAELPGVSANRSHQLLAGALVADAVTLPAERVTYVPALADVAPALEDRVEDGRVGEWRWTVSVEESGEEPDSESVHRVRVRGDEIRVRPFAEELPADQHVDPEGQPGD